MINPFQIYDYSDRAKKERINNSGNKEIFNNAMKLFQDQLLEIMKIFGDKMVVTSWYRCKELNDLVGGSKYSDHLKGNAVDFLYYFKDMKQGLRNIYETIKNSDIEYKQLIYYPQRNFIHISREDKDDMRKQAWIEGEI